MTGAYMRLDAALGQCEFMATGVNSRRWVVKQVRVQLTAVVSSFARRRSQWVGEGPVLHPYGNLVTR